MWTECVFDHKKLPPLSLASWIICASVTFCVPFVCQNSASVSERITHVMYLLESIIKKRERERYILFF